MQKTVSNEGFWAVGAVRSEDHGGCKSGHKRSRRVQVRTTPRRNGVMAIDSTQYIAKSVFVKAGQLVLPLSLS